MDSDTTPELWTIDVAAEYLGIQKGSARGLLSRRGVKRVDSIQHPDSGRDIARFRADEVRAVAADRRPGRRTDRA
ncbi:hypothetical protein [Streptomyces sp. or20]|uniref:hypothetical protein n=1 Tax=Streptomyces sp. or20 TaxID=1828016 RepID=UPI000BF0B9E9|nr:hypothetical protein [Streptomyces sp. or20]